MKKAIKAVVGMALALSFAVAPAAFSTGISSTATVSASSGFAVRRNGTGTDMAQSHYDSGGWHDWPDDGTCGNARA